MKGIIADCGYSNLRQQYFDLVRHYVGTVIASIFMVFCKMFYRLFTRYSMNFLNTYDVINNTNVPILFVHGGKDKFVLPKHTIKNYDAYNGPKTLLISENSDHCISFVIDKERYKKEALKIFEIEK